MGMGRLFLIKQAKRVVVIFRGHDGYVKRSSDWWSPEPLDIFVAQSDEWYGPRDWSPRKKRRGDQVLGEVHSDERVDVFSDGPNGQSLWSLDPFYDERTLIIIPASKKLVEVP